MQNDQVNNLTYNILATLTLFDLFKRPLTGMEIYQFLPERMDRTLVEKELKNLVARQAVYRFGNFYTLDNNQQLVRRRSKCDEQVAESMAAIIKFTNLLIHFPFVRGIAVRSAFFNPLVDGVAAIDLLIITSKNRLWLARCVLYAFKKLHSLFNKQSRVRLEYYLDESALAIRDKNLLAAVEVATLLPLQGDTVMEQFYAANTWTHHYLPNKVMRLSVARPIKPSFIKAAIERLFNHPLGDLMNDVVMKITLSNAVTMDVAKHYVRPNLHKFHIRLLAQYKSKLSQLRNTPTNAGQSM